MAAFLLLMPSGVSAADRSTPDPALCRLVTRHVPDPDVAYRAGVDVRGRPVVPADLDPAPTPTVSIPLTVDLSRLIGIAPVSGTGRTSAAAGAGLPEAPLSAYAGMLELRGGQLLLDGRPLNADVQSRLAVLCRPPDASGNKGSGNIGR
jgi:hypothetical protein